LMRWTMQMLGCFLDACISSVHDSLALISNDVYVLFSLFHVSSKQRQRQCALVLVGSCFRGSFAAAAAAPSAGTCL